MRRTLIGSLLGLLLLAGDLSAQGDIRQGKVKKVDADKGTIVLTVDGKDREFAVTEQTRFMSANNQPICQGLKADDFKDGTAVFFKAERRDGKDVLVGLKVQGAGDRRAAGGGQGGIRPAKIKKVNLDTLTVTLTIGGRDQEFRVTDETRFLRVSGNDLKERLRNFKAGADVQFMAGRKDGQDVLLGLALGAGGPPGRAEPPPKIDVSKLKPLTELGTGEYHGFPGGLYPDGKNDRPAAHEAAGVRLARQVQPLDADGKPSADGKIVLLSVGMSNTSQASDGFQRLLRGYEEKNPHVLFVNGAQGGMTAQAIQDPDDGGRGTHYWTEVDRRLRSAGVTRAQVQAVWIKQADAGPTEGFPGYAKKLQAELARVVQVLTKRFPNCKLCYLSSRTYGGYAKTRLNPEPYAYESAFSVKWLIEQQIKGDPALNFDPAKGAVKAPWLSWGPYLWAQGTTPRADGFSWNESDFSAGDGTHESSSGMEKVGRLLLDFFKSDTTTKPWFTRR